MASKKKPGKWDKLTASLPKHVPHEAAYAQKVEAMKEKVLTPLPSPNANAVVDLAFGTVQDAMRDVDANMERVRMLLQFALRGEKNAAAVTRAYAQVRRVKDELEAHAKAINLFEATYVALMEDFYLAEDVSMRYLEDGSSARLQPEPYASVNDAAAYRQWCIDNGYKDSMSLAWQTTNAIVKELLEKGIDTPPGLKVFRKMKVIFTDKEGTEAGALAEGEAASQKETEVIL